MGKIEERKAGASNSIHRPLQYSARHAGGLEGVNLIHQRELRIRKSLVSTPGSSYLDEVGLPISFVYL